MPKTYGYLYILTNAYNTAFYIGVTADLKRRIFEHKHKLVEGHTKKYNLNKLVYYEKYNSVVDAIKREKNLKNWERNWKIELIKQYNPEMIDLTLWINGNDMEHNINTKLKTDKNTTYEIPDCAIAGQARNDVDMDKKFNGKQVKIQCPAKINLTLKITGKRPDGFHNIESVMQTISLYDYLTISAVQAEKFEIKLSGTSNEIPYNEKNLVYKAASLFIERTNLTPHKIDIFIEKNIPVAAGLAGGSTDAAGTLFGLNKIFGNPLSSKELHALCAKLGSDLNFCLEGGRQMTRGRGEILEELPFEEFSLSLIKPENLGISAKEAYTKFSQKEKIGREDFVNDLEWAVIDDYKELQTIKNLYPDSIMSGSGSTYYIIGKEFEPLEDCWIKNGLKSIASGIKDVTCKN